MNNFSVGFGFVGAGTTGVGGLGRDAGAISGGGGVGALMPMLEQYSSMMQGGSGQGGAQATSGIGAVSFGAVYGNAGGMQGLFAGLGANYDQASLGMNGMPNSFMNGACGMGKMANGAQGSPDQMMQGLAMKVLAASSQGAQHAQMAKQELTQAYAKFGGDLNKPPNQQQGPLKPETHALVQMVLKGGAQGQQQPMGQAGGASGGRAGGGGQAGGGEAGAGGGQASGGEPMNYGGGQAGGGEPMNYGGGQAGGAGEATAGGHTGGGGQAGGGAEAGGVAPGVDSTRSREFLEMNDVAPEQIDEILAKNSGQVAGVDSTRSRGFLEVNDVAPEKANEILAKNSGQVTGVDSTRSRGFLEANDVSPAGVERTLAVNSGRGPVIGPLPPPTSPTPSSSEPVATPTPSPTVTPGPVATPAGPARASEVAPSSSAVGSNSGGNAGQNRAL